MNTEKILSSFSSSFWVDSILFSDIKLAIGIRDIVQNKLYNWQGEKSLILEKGIEEGNSYVNIAVYQHKTLNNMYIARAPRVNTKTEFNQVYYIVL